MVQVINDPNRNQGNSAVNALSTALQGLTQHKVNEMQQKKKAQSLGNAFSDIPQGALEYLSQLPPKEQLSALQSLGQSQKEQQTSEPTEEEMLKHLPAFMESPEAQELFTPEERQNILQQISQPQQKSSGLKLSQLGSPAGKSLDINFKHQEKIDKYNAPFLKTMNEYVTNAESRKKLAQEALELVESDKVTSGLKGLVPESILTALDSADSDFVKLTGQLANEKAVELRGPVGKAKLEAAARTKAKLSDPKEAQISALKREIEAANKAEYLAQAYKEILEENNEIQPANFEIKIRKRAKEIENGLSGNKSKESNKSSVVEEFTELPPASELTGKRIEFPDGSIRKSNGKEWVKE